MSQPGSAVVRRRRDLPDGIRTGARNPQWLLQQLPVGMLDSGFFVRFVSIFQELGATLLADADNIDNVVDLTVAPDAMVRWLGSWIGAEAIDSSLPDELQRRIVTSAAQTLVWRGTAAGLRRFLELTSGGPAEVTEGGGVWRDGEAPADTAWVRMRVESTGWLADADFVALVRDEVPAHVRAELFVGDRLLWSSEPHDAPVFPAGDRPGAPEPGPPGEEPGPPPGAGPAVFPAGDRPAAPEPGPPGEETGPPGAGPAVFPADHRPAAPEPGTPGEETGPPGETTER